MPTYVLSCQKCKHEYEHFCFNFDPTGKYPKAACPECKSKRKKVIPCFGGFNFKNPVGTDRWTSDSQGHEYRYRSEQPRIAKQREKAAKMSHMGENPYKHIDDISGYNGEI